MDKINEIIKSLLDRFADKKDTIRRLTSIEKQVRANSIYSRLSIDQDTV